MTNINYIKNIKLDVSLYQRYYYKLKNFIMLETYGVIGKLYLGNILLLNCSSGDENNAIISERRIKNLKDPKLDYFIKYGQK